MNTLIQLLRAVVIMLSLSLLAGYVWYSQQRANPDDARRLPSPSSDYSRPVDLSRWKGPPLDQSASTWNAEPIFASSKSGAIFLPPKPPLMDRRSIQPEVIPSGQPDRPQESNKTRISDRSAPSVKSTGNASLAPAQ
ncbi:MAG: hypothetical protein ACOYOF_17000 [Verrucomicrobiaceae bacterium]